MLELMRDQLFFLLSLAGVLVLPGWATLFFLERKGKVFTLLERAVLSVALSIVAVDFLVLSLDALRIKLFASSIAGVIGIYSVSLWGWAYYYFVRKSKNEENESQNHEKSQSSFSWVFLFVFLAMLAVKALYFVPYVVPSSTDLGHHMYWTKQITLQHTLPVYEEREIVKGDTGYEIGDAEPISDFIIGEHIIMAAIQMLSGVSVISAFPSLVLFVIHVVTALAVYVLALRLFERYKHREKVAIVSLFLFGALYTIAPPQMKYIVGGVVGNTIGNLLIPSIFLLLVMALRLRQVRLLAVSIVMMFGLAYTHHLSTLMFGVALVGTLGTLCILKWKMVREQLWPLAIHPLVLGTFAACLIFFFFVWTPSYITNAAVKTIVGEPTATEHQGFSFSQLKFAVGEPRMVFGALGLILLLLSRAFRRSETLALLAGWTVPLALLVLHPELARISLPSGRVANYLIVPLSILAGWSMVWLVENIRRQNTLPQAARVGMLTLLFVLVIHNGFFDNMSYLGQQRENIQKMRSLFVASDFLSKNVPQDQAIVHDHINILGDSWIKLFFMRDYNYPFYRANLFRYDRITDKQERCTLEVISHPNTRESTACMKDINIRALLVNETVDGQQFKHFKNYWQVYNDAYYSVYLYRSDQKSL